MATTQEKIAALYVAFFNRAADNDGLHYWDNQASLLNETEAMQQLAAGFATHTKFTDLYGHLENQDYVEAIYTNTLGAAGDTEGIAYWIQLLDQGMSRSDMVASFIAMALDFNPGDTAYVNLSPEEIALASQRQALIQNKVDVSLAYSSALGTQANLNPSTDPKDANALDQDPVFQASIAILSSVTGESSSVDSLLEAIQLLASSEEAIAIINDLSIIDYDHVWEALLAKDNPFSTINATVGTLSSVSTEGVATLDSGVHWSQREQLTFSFNQSIPDDYYDYGDDLTTHWSALNATQKSAVGSVIEDINALLDISLTEVAEGGAIQFNIVEMAEDTLGFSFYPGEHYSYGGDVFLSQTFNTDPNYTTITPGSEAWVTIVHELGHALGLKHPFEGSVTLDTAHNDLNHSVMSYTLKEAYIPTFTVLGSSIKIEYSLLFPEGYSLYDVAALQSIYGANTQTATEDTRYTATYSDYRLQTLWDAGGEDTIDLSEALGNSTIDLREGSLNSADQYSLDQIIALHQEGIYNAQFRAWIEDRITDLYENDELYMGANNFAIAQGTIIENIITGSGNDTITDNEVDNHISTSNGNDTIYIGSGGYDTIDGGDGNDSLYLNLLEHQVHIDQIDEQTYTIIAENFGATFSHIELIYFSNDHAYAPNDLIIA